ncbi:MAG TPA: hypothetical protein VFS24_09415 [Steroidobacteraceae bacterium]|nr:hypothetical protein [Steroidobacteraceae bacterium]
MTNSNRSIAACAQIALLLTLALAGCSKPPPATSEPSVTGPLVTAPTAPADTQRLKSSLTSNGIRSQYIAHVTDGRIRSIDEDRTGANSTAHGTYTFYEARLVKYDGDALNSAGRLDIEFDMHGAVTKSQAADGAASKEEIAAVRNRAELLRSHALTQLDVQAHGAT